MLGAMSWIRQLNELCEQGPVHLGVAAHHLDAPRRRILDLARRHGWWFPYPDVIAPPGVRRAPWVREGAAIAHVRGGAPQAPRRCALGRWSAAALLGVGPGAPRPPDVLVPAERPPRTSRGLVVLRSRGFDADAVMKREGLPVATAPWIVRSCAPVAEVGLLTNLVIDLVQRRELELAVLAEHHARWSRYPGRAQVSEVLARLGAAGRTDSTLELQARHRLVGAGVPLDPGQVVVDPGDGVVRHLDLGIARIRFGIELDSMLAHSTRSQLRRDIRRSNALAMADDWCIVRATWEDLETGWEPFIATVRRAVREQSRRHLGVDWPTP